MTTSSRSSDLKSASALIATGKNRINSILMIGDGTNAGTLTVYDNTSASGMVLAQTAVGSQHHTAYISFPNPIYAEKGIYASLSGTGATFVLHYGG